MELGLSTYAFPWTFNGAGDLFEKLHRMVNAAVRLKVQRIQVCDNAPLDQLSDKEQNAFLDLVSQSGVLVEVGTRGLHFDNVLRYLQFAVQYNSGFLRLVIDDTGYEPPAEEIKQLLSALIPHFKEAGIKLALENHDRFLASELVDFIESTDPGAVAICLDSVNSLGAGEGINEVLDYLATYCINLHVKDITIRRLESNMGFNIRGCPAGQGDLDFPNIINRCSQGQRLESISLELWPDDLPPGTDPEELELQWAEQSISYLKKILNH